MDMPEMDGVEVIMGLQPAGVPVIAISGGDRTSKEAPLDNAHMLGAVETLSKLAQAAEPPLGDASGSSEGARSVEDLVTEMLRPMLRDWLDQNLPAIVERIVQKEIRRLVRQAEPD